MNKLVNHFYEYWRQIARLFNPQRRQALFIVLLGGPGAGKGTIAARLAPRYGIPHLSTGNLIRREVAEQTAIGRIWGPAIKQGKLVPDAVIFYLLERELQKPEYFRGAVLDGFPRTVSQARTLRRRLAAWGTRVNVAVFLDVSESDLLERLAMRRTCSNTACARSYHLRFNPPVQEGICDICGSRLYQRDDEREEAVRTRMQEFNRTFEPLRRFYQSTGALATVASRNCDGIDHVFEEAVFAVDEAD